MSIFDRRKSVLTKMAPAASPNLAGVRELLGEPKPAVRKSVSLTGVRELMREKTARKSANLAGKNRSFDRLKLSFKLHGDSLDWGCRFE